MKIIGHNDDGSPIIEIGADESEARRKKNEQQVFDEAQRDVIDPLNEETSKPGDPGYIGGDGSSPGSMPKGEK